MRDQVHFVVKCEEPNCFRLLQRSLCRFQKTRFEPHGIQKYDIRFGAKMGLFEKGLMIYCIIVWDYSFFLCMQHVKSGLNKASTYVDD